MTETRKVHDGRQGRTTMARTLRTTDEEWEAFQAMRKALEGQSKHGAVTNRAALRIAVAATLRELEGAA